VSPFGRIATVVGVSLTTVLALCVGTAVACDSVMDCNNTAKVGPVKDDPARIAQLFPAIGPVTAAHWQAREARPAGCFDIGPMDYVYEGLFTLPPTPLDWYGWQPADPHVLPALAGYAPPGAEWRHSKAFDVRMLASGAAEFFEARGIVYFRYTSN
jgi:hypothetical protein